MKPFLALLLMMLAVPAAAEVMTFPSARIGDVSFDHTLHRAQLKGCSVCHGGAPGKIHKEWVQQNAHDFCVDCHNKMDRGPLRCAGCHKKKPVKPAAVTPQKPVTSVTK
jgi:predicted CXXCH cytochrome family protein